MEFCDRKIVLSSKRTAAKFENFRQNSQFCDVSLQSGQAVVKAHRVVLAAASSYFETMFNNDFKEGIESLLNLPDLSPDVLPSVLDFIYTGRVTITSSMVQELLAAAKKLCVSGLITSCVRYLKTQLNTSNVLSMLSLGDSLGSSKFNQCVLAYIGEHWTIIAQGNELLELPLALFLKILSSNGFVVDSELEVVLAVIRWLEHDPVSRAPHCSELMRHLRLGRVPAHVLDEVWRTVRDTRVQKSFQLSEEKAAAIANARARNLGTFYILTPLEDDEISKYNIYKKVWEYLPLMQTLRSNSSITALGGRLYLVGGQDGSLLASGKAYDPITDEWSPIAPMNQGRSHFVLAVLMGELYAFGGYGYNEYFTSIEAYDPATDVWTPVGEMPHEMAGFTVVAHKGSLYLTHERSLLRYTPSAGPGGEWHSCAEMAVVHTYHGAAVLDHHLYVVGGCNEDGYAQEIVERYSFAADRWEFVTPMPVRIEMCSASAADGVLLVAGEKSLQMYDADEERWTPGPDPPPSEGVTGSAVLW